MQSPVSWCCRLLVAAPHEQHRCRVAKMSEVLRLNGAHSSPATPTRFRPCRANVLMLIAMLLSRLWWMPQSEQIHSRSEGFGSRLKCPQRLQVFAVGSNLPILKSVLPYLWHFWLKLVHMPRSSAPENDCTQTDRHGCAAEEKQRAPIRAHPMLGGLGHTGSIQQYNKTECSVTPRIREDGSSPG